MAKYKLLAVEADSKTTKGSAYGVLTGILYLAPSLEADGVHNLCPMATKECIAACLNGAGMAAVFPSIKEGRIRKTLALLADRPTFVETLKRDITKLVAEARQTGMRPAVRINGTSDQPALARELALVFPNVQFYDYTKIPRPWERALPNYHLTFSFSGQNLADCLAALEHGVNVAVVFSSASFPETWNGHRVINGDESDLRFRDPSAVIVGLKAKGPARQAVVGGFVQAGLVAIAGVK